MVGRTILRAATTDVHGRRGRSIPHISVASSSMRYSAMRVAARSASTGLRCGESCLIFGYSSRTSASNCSALGCASGFSSSDTSISRRRGVARWTSAGNTSGTSRVSATAPQFGVRCVTWQQSNSRGRIPASPLTCFRRGYVDCCTVNVFLRTCRCECSALPPQVRLPSPNQHRCVALRTFADRDGQHWRVWSVQPSSRGISVRAEFRQGWLCFERLDGSCRCRLSAGSAPDDWEVLPDERLDLLRRMAGTG